MIYFIIALLLVSISYYFLFRYLEGDFTIDTIEEIFNTVYNISKSNIIGNYIPSGKETRIVTKITYESKRVKYKTYSFKS